MHAGPRIGKRHEGAAAGAHRDGARVKKYTKGAQWNCMIRFEDGSMYRLSQIPEQTHTNAAMIKSIEENFIPAVKAAKKWIAKAKTSRRAAERNPA